MGPSARRAPWHFLERDQLVLYALCLLLLAVVAARYVVASRGNTKPVRRLMPGPPIDYLVNVNEAEPAELDLLPGIGPALAARIIRYRNAKGRFQRLDDLAAVPGISHDTVRKLHGLATVGPKQSGGDAPR